MPSYTPDGKGLVFWQLDSLNSVATGTTPVPTRQPRTYYATHNLYVLDLADGTSRLAIVVRAQLPLAPPRAFADGSRVTVAGMDVRAPVSYKGEVSPYGTWGVGKYYADSLIVGDLATGLMESLVEIEGQHSAPRIGEKVIFDVGGRSGSEPQRLLFSWGGSDVAYSDERAGAITSTRSVQRIKSGNPMFGTEVKHAAFSMDGKSFVHIFGSRLAIAPVRDAPEFSFITLPVWRVQ
jgi:hypothetical protein